jgi:hypothetical protein
MNRVFVFQVLILLVSANAYARKCEPRGHYWKDKDSLVPVNCETYMGLSSEEAKIDRKLKPTSVTIQFAKNRPLDGTNPGQIQLGKCTISSPSGSLNDYYVASKLSSGYETRFRPSFDVWSELRKNCKAVTETFNLLSFSIDAGASLYDEDGRVEAIGNGGPKKTARHRLKVSKP